MFGCSRWHMEESCRFMTDITLGKLTKWLRIMGCDVHFFRGAAGTFFLNDARKESRIALTRKNLPPRQYTGTLLVIHSDDLEEQISEVIKGVCLKPDPASFFSLCLKCNEKLKHMDRKDAEGHVPRYVFESGHTFRSCPACGKIYWQGTHIDRVLNVLRKHIQIDHP